MADLRKNKRLRNRRNGIKLDTNMIAIVSILGVIIILIIILLSKNIKKDKIKVEDDTNERLYTLFEEIDLAGKNLAALSETSKDDTKINIVAVGDILCETPIYESVYNLETEKYDFSSIFANVAKYTQEADLTVGLLETNFVDGEEISRKQKI